MTIIENIFSGSKNKINKLNSDFFSKLLDKDFLLHLVDIRHYYIDIVSYNIKKERQELIDSIKKLIQDYNKLKIKKNVFIKEKIINIQRIAKKNNLNYINEDKKITRALEKIIKDMIDKKELILAKKNQLLNLKYKPSKAQLKIDLKQKLLVLKNTNISVDKLYDEKEKYSKLFKNITTNKNAIKCYSNYIFEMIVDDIDNLLKIYHLACNLISTNTIYKLDNISAIMEYKLNIEQNNFLDSYTSIINNKKVLNSELNKISDEYVRNKTIINAMMHYAKNYKDLYNNKMLDREFDVIKEMTSNNQNNVIDISDICTSFNDIALINKYQFNNLVGDI